MARYDQQGRPIRVETVLGEDVLLLESFTGREAISEPFVYHLRLLSEDADISADDLLRTEIKIILELPDGGERTIHGLFGRFAQLGSHNELTFYEAEVVPWFWFLSLSRDSKIFQEMSVPDIVEEVFSGLGHADAYTLELKESYEPREYCVQYRESHLDFVARLLEEEGIYFYFEHSAGGHKLTMVDDISSLKPCPGTSSARLHSDPVPHEDVVLAATRESAVHIGRVTLTDYDFLQPSMNLLTSVSGAEPEEVYDYPGKYSTLGDGDRYAQLRLEAAEATRNLLRGESTCRSFQSGHRFELSDHPAAAANRDYALLEVRHAANAGSYLTWGQGDDPLTYLNQFIAMPHDVNVPYRPHLRTRRPNISGSQTALVVGPSGEEIWVDKHGRVKVQFFWDRLGEKDENSSCWVRVSSAWAGKSWGAIHIPRIGQEVIVDFLEGDPDRPIITGRVYNATQVPPYDLPANQSQSGVKSRSTKGGGTSDFNEIRMEDLKGNEELYIHAQKDKKVVVENDRDESVGRDESINIERNRSERVGKDENVTIEDNQTHSVGKNQTLSVGDNQTLSVGKNRGIDVGKNHDETIGTDMSLKVGKNRNLDIGDTLTEKVGKDHRETVKKGYALQAKEIFMSAKDKIEIKVGKASIVMKKNGDITIKGGKINIKGSGAVTIKGSKIAEN